MSCCGGGAKFQAIEPAARGALAAIPAPAEVVARFDETTLAVGKPGRRFNASILGLGDGYLYAYRDGWAGSNIHTVRLDRAFRPIEEPRQLALRHRDANYGREDPRLFWHQGKPHVNFVGVQSVRGGIVTNQLFARLSSDGGRVEDVFHPAIEARRSWEKNHAYFDHDGQLFAVYTVDPWNYVMRITSNRAAFVHRTITPRPWLGGEQRGGAPPVRVGREYWHFTHSRQREKATGRLRYEMGLHTFAAEPPFRPLRIMPTPIKSELDTQPPDNPNYADVLFPGGAVLAGDRWVIAFGVHDRWSEIRTYSAAELERRLIPVEEPPRRKRPF